MMQWTNHSVSFIYGFKSVTERAMCMCIHTLMTKERRVYAKNRGGKETEMDGGRAEDACEGRKDCKVRHMLWNYNDCSVFPPMPGATESIHFFTTKAKHLFLFLPRLSPHFSSNRFCSRVCLVNPGLKCGAMTGVWCLSADTHAADGNGKVMPCVSQKTPYGDVQRQKGGEVGV